MAEDFSDDCKDRIWSFRTIISCFNLVISFSFLVQHLVHPATSDFCSRWGFFLFSSLASSTKFPFPPMPSISIPSPWASPMLVPSPWLHPFYSPSLLSPQLLTNLYPSQCPHLVFKTMPPLSCCAPVLLACPLPACCWLSLPPPRHPSLPTPSPFSFPQMGSCREMVAAGIAPATSCDKGSVG